MEHFLQTLYFVAGAILPAFYLPQILHCIRDNTGLHAFSMSKSLFQLILRMVMLSYLFTVGNSAIIFIALFDALARIFEFIFAVHALRRQKCTWSEIRKRLNLIVPVQSFLSGFKSSTVRQ